MTQGGEGSNLRWILGLVAHLSVFSMFAAFLPLTGEMLWWLVVPPLALLIIGAVVATRADDPVPEPDASAGREPDASAGHESESRAESADGVADEDGTVDAGE